MKLRVTSGAREAIESSKGVSLEGKAVASSSPPPSSELAPQSHSGVHLDVALGALAPKNRSIQLLSTDEVYAQIEALAAAGARVSVIGHSKEGRPIHAITVGEGPKTVVAMAGAHPDEPVGTVSILHFVRRLLTDPALEHVRKSGTFHLVPQANPDGAVRNEPWLSSWTASPKLSQYFEHARRDGPKDDVEFGFPNEPGGEARPENRAIAKWFDGLGDIDHYVSLHSMFLGGGGLMLVMTDDHAAHAGQIRFVLEQFDRAGLPLHDKDRFGQKGFHRIGPGLQTAPTKEEMGAFFAAGGSKDVAASFRLNSMQYVSQFNGCPLAFVSEVPLCYDAALSSMTPVSHSRREEEERLSKAFEDLAGEADQLAAELSTSGLGKDVVAPIEEIGASLRRVAQAQLGDLDRYKDAPATQGNVRERELTVQRRRCQLLARALQAVRSAQPNSPMCEELQSRLENHVATMKSEFRLKHPSLETQVLIQNACLLAGLTGPSEKVQS